MEAITEHGIIYGPPRVLSGWDLSASERAMMKKHLEWLKKKGMAYSDKDHFYLASWSFPAWGFLNGLTNRSFSDIALQNKIVAFWTISYHFIFRAAQTIIQKP